MIKLIAIKSAIETFIISALLGLGVGKYFETGENLYLIFICIGVGLVYVSRCDVNNLRKKNNL